MAHVYGKQQINERHRHRYEVNDAYKDFLISSGVVVSGTSAKGQLVECIERPDHPHFVAVQFHPEFKSHPQNPHPLFTHFVQAALDYHHAQNRFCRPHSLS